MTQTVKFERSIGIPVLSTIIPIAVSWGLVGMLGYSLFMITGGDFAHVIPLIVIASIATFSIVCTNWYFYIFEKKDEEREYEAFKEHRITVKNKQCCGGSSEIYTEEFHDIIFNVSRIDYFNMEIGKKYLIYSSIVDGRATRTQLVEELK